MLLNFITALRDAISREDILMKDSYNGLYKPLCSKYNLDENSISEESWYNMVGFDDDEEDAESMYTVITNNISICQVECKIITRSLSEAKHKLNRVIEDCKKALKMVILA